MPPCELLVRRDTPEMLDERVEAFCKWEQWENKFFGGVGMGGLLSEAFGKQPGPLGDGARRSGLFGDGLGPV